MMKLHPHKAGFTTVELLVVLAIIGFLAAITIPLLFQMGLFGGREVELAARDLFTLMTAARTYATTNNIETAVAYSGGTHRDSFTDLPVPIIDSFAVVRRVRRVDFEGPDPGFQRLSAINGLEWALDNPVFVAVRAEEGNFRRFEGDACILPDVFELDFSGFSPVSAQGLTGILIWDLDCFPTGDATGCFVEPRSNYRVDSLLGARTFPAHRFRPSGDVIVNGARQRAVLRLGLLPDLDPDDRYFEPPIFPVPNPIIDTTVQFDSAPLNYRTFGAAELDDEVDVDVEIYIYVATGRIKVSS